MLHLEAIGFSLMLDGDHVQLPFDLRVDEILEFVRLIRGLFYKVKNTLKQLICLVTNNPITY